MESATFVIFVGGLTLLILGAEWLVRGASALAGGLGLSPLVVGLTVVALGTSAPELAVSLSAALAGQSELALGNVVGSNIANVLLILGISAVIAPLVVTGQIIKRDVPVMIGVSLTVLLMAMDGTIGRVDGLVLVAGILLYTWTSIAASRREVAAAAAGDAQERVPPTRMAIEAGRAIVGLALLLVGTRGVVGGATAIAEAIGVSDLLIGLTIVAIGTSLPEAATSVVATLRGARELAVGNAVGSNIYNLLLILGLTAIVRPIGVPREVFDFDLPVMVAVAAACLPVFFTGGRIARWEGWAFLLYYTAYLTYLALDATNHDSLPTYHAMMVVFVAPLTGLTLIALAVTERARRAA